MVIQRKKNYANMQHPNQRDCSLAGSKVSLSWMSDKADAGTMISKDEFACFPEHEKHFILEWYIT